ncbi:MAG: hypothetical protein CM1200mP10_13850 [Candidatus Neomarinimicrobiota bacterium]|nr:MAG: hypothetical protein CM1200mP10_13850 [Candidatus Neomarinimicrobiota bacterium]
MGNFGFKVSTVVLRGEDWHHYNVMSMKVTILHSLAVRIYGKKGIDEGGVNGEFGNPYFTEEMLDYWPDSDPTFVGRRFIYGIDGHSLMGKAAHR